MRLALNIAVVFVLLWSGSAQAQSATDPTLNKLAADFVAAFNAKDAAKVAAFYTDDAVLMPPNAPLAKGRAAIQAYFEATFKQGLTDLRLSPLESAIAGQQAFDAGTSSVQVRGGGSSLTLTGVGGSGAAVRSQGKYITVYKRVRGEWKISYDIFNDDKPATP